MKYTIEIARIPNNYAAYLPGLSGCEATVSTSEELLEEIRGAIPGPQVAAEVVEVSAARA